MLRSMTAYSRVSIKTKVGHFLVEIQTVNRKFLEVNLFLPKDLLRFDPEVKKWINNAISRGQVTIKISATLDQNKKQLVSPNLPLARGIKKAWDLIAEDLHLSPSQGFTLDMLVKEQGILYFEDELEDSQLYRDVLQEVVESALRELIQMKELEGANLSEYILQQWGTLKEIISQIAVKAQNAVQKYRQKLVARLEEVLPGCVENEEKILREVCIFADKIDISEEIDRFNSHLGQVKDLILSDASSIGKKLEFILQELSREMNTIGSKSQDIEIGRLVIDAKTELERIREQIQNVE